VNEGSCSGKNDCKGYILMALDLISFDSYKPVEDKEF
jgi:hypothetical protein